MVSLLESIFTCLDLTTPFPESFYYINLSAILRPRVALYNRLAFIHCACHGVAIGMRCGLGSLVRISELNSAIAFLSLKNAIALFSSEMCTKLPSPHLIPEP